MLVDPVRGQRALDVLVPPVVRARLLDPRLARCSSRRGRRGRRRSSSSRRWRGASGSPGRSSSRGRGACTPRSRARRRRAARTVSRRVSMNARVAGETSSAYTWSPSISSTSGQSSRGSPRMRQASVCSASISRPRSSSSLRQRERRLVRRRHAAGAEHHPQRRLLRIGVEGARRPAVGARPDALAVEAAPRTRARCPARGRRSRRARSGARTRRRCAPSCRGSPPRTAESVSTHSTASVSPTYLSSGSEHERGHAGTVPRRSRFRHRGVRSFRRSGARSTRRSPGARAIRSA